MANKKPLVLYSGEIEEIRDADVLSNSAGIALAAVSITVPWDVGGGLTYHQQEVPVSGLTSASRLSVALAAKPDVDDNDVEELESFLVSASYAADGVALISASFPAPVTGPVNLILTVM